MDSRCSVAHVVKIAEFLPRWKFVGRQLGLSEQQLDDLKAQYPDPAETRGEMLAKWVAISGPQATYKKLYDILVELDEGDAAEKVRRLVERPSGKRFHDVYSCYFVRTCNRSRSWAPHARFYAPARTTSEIPQ